MGNFPIKNFTHYDTGDLEKLVEHVSDVISEVTQEVPALRSEVQRIEFYEYTPTSAVQVVRTWNNQKNDYDSQLTRKFVGQGIRTRPERIALLVPKMIWKNPLEALTAAIDGEESVPPAMVERIASAVLDVFNVASWRYHQDGRSLKLDLDQHRVRVRKTVGVKAGDDDKKREKLRLARRAGVEAGYYLNSALPAIEKGIEQMIRMQKYDSTPEMKIHIEAAKVALTSLFDIRAIGVVAKLQSLKERRRALGDVDEVSDG
jgi:hypothetical protein